MYKLDLELDNQQWLIYHKIKTNQYVKCSKCYYVHFQINTFRKGMNLLILPSMS